MWLPWRRNASEKPARLKLANRKVLVPIILAAIGVATVFATKAATPSSSLEAENGTRNGNVCSTSDSSASGQGYVRFGSACKDIFVSATGNDSSNGNTEAQALKTITKAVQLANGTTRIRIMSGTYIETVRIQKNDITLEPYGNGDVTINGAIPELISGAGISWAADSAGVYTTALPGNRNEATLESNAIYDSSGKQLWSYYNDPFSMSNISANYPGAPGAPRPGSALYSAFFTNYIKVRTNAGAPTPPLYIGAALPTIDILNASNIKLNSIAGSKLKLVYGSQNVQIRDSSKITINELDITGGTYGVALYNSSEVSITKNNIHGALSKDTNYKEVKEYTGGKKTMENAAIKTSATTKDINKIVIDGNELTGYWAAISMYTEYGRGTTTLYHTDDSVISNNLVHDMAGVGIEPEVPARNLIIKGNTVYDTFEPFSPAPAFVGPTYVYENLFVANRTLVHDPYTLEVWGPSTSIKMNNDTVAPPENIYYYNNTFYQAGNGHSLRMTVQTTRNPAIATKNVSFLNNIFFSTDSTIIDGTGLPADTINFGGNIFYSQVSSPWRYFAWNSYYDDGATNSYPSLQAIKDAGAMPSQWQANTEGNPSFNCVDATNNSCFRPSASIAKPTSLQPVPSNFPEGARLNARTKIGAFE